MSRLTLFLCLFAFHLPTAGAAPSAVEADLRRLFEISQPDIAQFRFMDMDVFSGAMTRNPNVSEAVWTSVRREVDAGLKELLYGPGGLIEPYIQELAQRFSESEIRAVLAFHESPIGQKWIKEANAMATSMASMEVLSKYLMKFIALQQEVLMKHGLRP